jgi:hypothetical protein
LRLLLLLGRLLRTRIGRTEVTVFYFGCVLQSLRSYLRKHAGVFKMSFRTCSLRQVKHTLRAVPEPSCVFHDNTRHYDGERWVQAVGSSNSRPIKNLGKRGVSAGSMAGGYGKGPEPTEAPRKKSPSRVGWGAWRPGLLIFEKTKLIS